MREKYWPIWIIGIIIFLTLFFYLLSLRYDGMCTEMGCPCSSRTSPNLTGERPCNTCFSGNPVFISIVFNLVRNCEFKEIVICENGVKVGERYDEENKVCRYDPYILIFNLRYLDKSLEMLTNRQPAIQLNGTSFPGGE